MLSVGNLYFVWKLSPNQPMEETFQKSVRVIEVIKPLLTATISHTCYAPCHGVDITHIAFGFNPYLCVFQQSAMREHLLKCLEYRKWNHFQYRAENRDYQQCQRSLIYKCIATVGALMMVTR